MYSTRAIVVLFSALATVVYGHGALVGVSGANGVTGQGIGIIATTPRTGTTRNPFQQDTSIIRDREIAKGTAGVCGRTLAGGNNDVAAGVSAASDAGLPTMADDGTVSMTLHQINGDGAGPYTCEISTDATGAQFEAMTVVTNVPGTNSRSRAKATDFPLVAKAAAGTTCTGGPNGDACIVRCKNAANAGPFGGCAVVSSGGSNSTASTTSAAAADTTSAADATSTAAADTTSAADATATDATATDTPTAADATATDDATAAAATETSAVAKSSKTKSNSAAACDVSAASANDDDDDEEQPAKRSLVERFANHMGYYKRDYTRKRMFPSRIVDSEKRAQWI